MAISARTARGADHWTGNGRHRGDADRRDEALAACHDRPFPDAEPLLKDALARHPDDAEGSEAPWRGEALLQRRAVADLRGGEPRWRTLLERSRPPGPRREARDENREMLRASMRRDKALDLLSERAQIEEEVTQPQASEG